MKNKEETIEFEIDAELLGCTFLCLMISEKLADASFEQLLEIAKILGI